MWYPPRQYCQQLQQQISHGYISDLSPHKQQQQHNCSRTSYYRSTDESPIANRTITSVVLRNDDDESFIHYHATYTDDAYGTSANFHINNSTDSYSDEMLSSSLSLPYQTLNTTCNPVISAPIKVSTDISCVQQNHITSITSSSSTSWDWLLYPPEVYPHLYVPSSIFVHQYKQDNDLDLLARLPTWLCVLLNPSLKQNHITEDENICDQEIHSLHNNNHDEALLSMNIDKKLNQVSSNASLSSENTQKLKQNRSSTPDTDDGYQSSSDASRSDYCHQSSVQCDRHSSKDDITINIPLSLTPKRLSYAAAVKPTVVSNNNKVTPLSAPTVKTKNNLSSSTATKDILNDNGSKLKFVAPRFERMHHAKQHSSSTIPMMKVNNLSLINRGQVRSRNNNNNQRYHNTRRR